METLTNLLTRLADYVVYELLGISNTDTFGIALHYFLIAFSTISILVILITYVMGIVTSYMPMEKIRDYLDGNKKSGFGNVAASLLGAVTPFCSCSSIPMFVGMMQARIPLGISLSFLITSPLVNELAIAIFWVSYGWKVTIVYIFSGISLGIIGGIILEKLGMERYVAEWLKSIDKATHGGEKDTRSLLKRFPEIHLETIKTLKKLVPFIFIGIAIGSFIHGYVPESFFETYISKSNPLAVPIAVLISIPLYIDAVGILPILDSLVDKGVPLGTAMAFMMGAIGLSIPEGLLLKKVMQKKLIIAFFSTITIGMVLSGFLFNLIL